MTSEIIFVLAIVAIVVAVILVVKNQYGIKRSILNRLNISREADQHHLQEPEYPATVSELTNLAAEKKSKAELKRLHNLIEDRKRLARETDISYHLWSLYESQFRNTSLHARDRNNRDGRWYDLKILHVSNNKNLNISDFELNGARYKFVDDEEQRGWSDNIKFFSLFLYDDSDRCLIEIPVKIKVDKWGRKYSILSDGPKAFLHGDWVNDFVYVTLKHQHIRNQEIRAQKHQERLREIEDLKDRFGISR
jgi:hypothetical protein